MLAQSKIQFCRIPILWEPIFSSNAPALGPPLAVALRAGGNSNNKENCQYMCLKMGFVMSKHNFAEVMADLEAMGTEQNRKVYRRHGAGENLFGVSFANLNKLRKQIKRDHPLVLQLWDSKNIDARCLATLIADPAQMSESDIDGWLRDISYYPQADLFVRHLVIKSPLAAAKMEQ